MIKTEAGVRNIEFLNLRILFKKLPHIMPPKTPKTIAKANEDNMLPVILPKSKEVFNRAASINANDRIRQITSLTADSRISVVFVEEPMLRCCVNGITTDAAVPLRIHPIIVLFN